MTDSFNKGALKSVPCLEQGLDELFHDITGCKQVVGGLNYLHPRIRIN